MHLSAACRTKKNKPGGIYFVCCVVELKSSIFVTFEFMHQGGGGGGGRAS